MQPPTHALVSILFGAQAGLILEELPERLRRWDTAFDEWLGDTYQRSPRLMIKRHSVWRNFLKFSAKPPWEIEPADVQAWVDHLLDERGLAPGSIPTLLCILHNFYRFAMQQAIESEAVDPVGAVSAPYNPSPAPAYTLNEAELAAFVAAIDHQTSALGKRNYAMILLILACGLSPREVRLARYGDLMVDWPNSVIVLRRVNLVTPLEVKLPGEVSAAIHDYLQAAGRLEEIQAGEALFPGASPSYTQNGPHSSKSWQRYEALGESAFTGVVYNIARRAGLNGKRVSPLVIRNTALARRIQLGDDMPALQRFVGFENRSRLYGLKKRIVSQPSGAQRKQDGQDGGQQKLYAGALPPAELNLLKQAQPVGLQDEIDALRLTLMHTLREAQGGNRAEQLRLLDSYSAGAARLASLLKTQKELEQKGDDFDARLEAALRQVQEEKGWDLGF